jgi:DNA-binding PadR family transcriptional regulator
MMKSDSVVTNYILALAAVAASDDLYASEIWQQAEVLLRGRMTIEDFWVRLHRLEQQGHVAKVFAPRGRVEKYRYRLTDRGRRELAALEALVKFAHQEPEVTPCSA